MNLISNKKVLPFFIALLGILALILHLGMQLWGTDEKGLLISAHPLSFALLAVTALACLTVAFSLRKPADFDGIAAFPAFAAIGAFALAGGILVSVLSGFGGNLRMEQIRNLCGIAAVPALIAAALKRFSGKQPCFLLPALVCLYLMLHTISHYQLWSSRPQLMDWFFPMAASVLLCLFSYQQTALCVSMGSPRMNLATGLLAGFFCIGAAVLENGMLYLGGAVWALTNLNTLYPEKDRGHEAA